MIGATACVYVNMVNSNFRVIFTHWHCQLLRTSKHVQFCWIMFNVSCISNLCIKKWLLWLQVASSMSFSRGALPCRLRMMCFGKDPFLKLACTQWTPYIWKLLTNYYSMTPFFDMFNTHLLPFYFKYITQWDPHFYFKGMQGWTV